MPAVMNETREQALKGLIMEVIEALGVPVPSGKLLSFLVVRRVPADLAIAAMQELLAEGLLEFDFGDLKIPDAA